VALSVERRLDVPTQWMLGPPETLFSRRPVALSVERRLDVPTQWMLGPPETQFV
jgi:hypothetical protein